MKRIRSHLIGIDSGDTTLFSDFVDGGPMWTGSGGRERRVQISFSDRFRDPPSVQTSISLLDASTEAAIRSELTAENVTESGFALVFRTWGDSRFARLRATWTAIGELPDPDDWELY